MQKSDMSRFQWSLVSGIDRWGLTFISLPSYTSMGGCSEWRRSGRIVVYFIDVYGIEIISMMNDSKNFGVWHMSSGNDLFTGFLEAMEARRDHRIVI